MAYGLPYRQVPSSLFHLHHSLPCFIFLKSIKCVSYRVALNVLVYTISLHRASIGFVVTLKYHTGFLKSLSLSLSLTIMLLIIKKFLPLFIHAEIDPHVPSQSNIHIKQF